MTEKDFDECMIKICQGDKEALKTVYLEYNTYIYSIVYTMLGNRENSEDICSDFFIKLWTNSDKYKSGSGHKGYLATIARNMCIDFIRKNKREMLIAEFETNQDDEGGLSGENRLNIAGGCDESEIEKTVVGDINLRSALERLKPSQKEVVNLKIMGEFTFKEISAIIKKPIGTVTWLYREAIENLRKYGFEQ